MVKITDIRDKKTVFQTLLQAEKICLQVKDCVRSLNCMLEVVFHQPLILLAVNNFLRTYISERAGRRLMVLLLTNTVVAILAGLLVANVLQLRTWNNISLSGDKRLTAKRSTINS